MTRLYTFDMHLKAAVTVEADSRGEAERIVEGILNDCTFARFSERDGDADDAIEGEVSLSGPLTLAMIDGEEVETRKADTSQPSIKISGFMATAKNGVTGGVFPSPRAAAADLFGRYIGVRKVRVGAVRDIAATGLVTHVFNAAFYRDITRTTLAALPDSVEEVNLTSAAVGNAPVEIAS